uniref:Prefoldin subunit 1 n=1 Tax=Podarcis muralis TaxID=64176 RepID=A0A670J6V2_PODMU
MAAPVDLELKKAFTELQAKVIDTQQKVKLADLQIEQLNRTKKHAHLTDTEIMTLADETRMYEGVGRMFILQSKGVIHSQLLDKQKIAEEKIKELEGDCCLDLFSGYLFEWQLFTDFARKIALKICWKPKARWVGG